MSTALLPRPLAIAILLGAATLFASNHVAARFAFDSGVGVLFALLARSSLAFVLMTTLALQQKQSFRLPQADRKWQLAVGVLIAIQSITLYSAVARLPVAIALLMINTWPSLFILLNALFRGDKPDRAQVVILAVILFGLLWILDVPNALAGQPSLSMVGLACGLASSICMALAFWLSEHRLGHMAGSVRSSYTMLAVIIAVAVVGQTTLIPGGLTGPSDPVIWYSIAGLAICYGIGSVLLFVLSPRLDLGRNGPLLNFEPLASLALAFVVLGQSLTTTQLIGAGILFSGLVALSLKRAR